MVHFEFGQDRLTQPHPLNTFELAQRQIKGAFVLFSTILLGLGGFVLQNHFLPPLGLAWYSHASRYGLNRSDAIFRIVESAAVAGRGVIALLLELPLVEFSRSFGRFRIH